MSDEGSAAITRDGDLSRDEIYVQFGDFDCFLERVSARSAALNRAQRVVGADGAAAFAGLFDAAADAISYGSSGGNKSGGLTWTLRKEQVDKLAIALAAACV